MKLFRLLVLGIIFFALTSVADARTVRKFRWSGETWTVRHTYGFSNPGHNIFSDSDRSVWVDSKRRLVLKIRNGRAVEIYGPRRNYGTFTWNVDTSLTNLDLWRVIGLFAWAPDGNEQDIEFARWGVPASPIGWSVGWANGTRANFTNFNVTSYAPYTVRLTVDMQSVHYSVIDARGTTLADVSYAVPFQVTVSNFGFQPRMNYWLWPGVRGVRLPKQHRYGFHPIVRLNSFRYTPMVKTR